MKNDKPPPPEGDNGSRFVIENENAVENEVVELVRVSEKRIGLL